jgi:hypothetical protein
MGVFVAKNVTFGKLCHFLQFWWIWKVDLSLRRCLSGFSDRITGFSGLTDRYNEVYDLNYKDMKRSYLNMGVTGSPCVGTPESRLRALWAAAGRDVNILREYIEYLAVTPPPPPKLAE